MNKNYITPRKTLLHSGLLALGMLTLVGFKDVDLEKSKTESAPPVQTTELYQVKVNFQDKATTPPDGYLKDYGKEFGFSSATTLETDYQYGWKLLADDTPFDVSGDNSNDNGVGRNRIQSTYASASIQEKLEGTLVHFQGNDVIADGVREWKNQPRFNEVYWELEVPNGNYKVTVGLGDKSTENVDSRHSVTIEGYTAIAAFVPTAGQTKTGTIVVNVEDGLLTVKGMGGFNSKIDYIEVSEEVADDPVTGELAFTPAADQLNVNLGETGNLTTTLAGAGAVEIGLAIDNNLTLAEDKNATGTNDWISLPPTAILGEYVFPVTATAFTAGTTRSNTIIATAVGFKPASFDASLLVGCPPLSTLTCDQVVTPMPVNLTFEGTDGGLVDAAGNQTGFTAAVPHNGTRLTEDPVASYISVNGYEPTTIDVSGGTLSLTAAKGLALRDANKQVNTLSVGLQSITASTQIETKLMGIETGADGFAQAGINFGVNQDNYVKLAIINNNIELRKEIDGVSADGENNADNIIAKNLDIAGKDVTLALIIDPQENTITGYYAVDDGEFIRVENGNNVELALPQALLDGRTVADGITGVSLAGVFASYNQADTSFDAEFDYFEVKPENLSIDSNSLNAPNGIVAYPNPATSELNVRLGQNATTVKSITVYDIQGRTVSSFEPNAVKSNNGFKLPTANLRSGVYFVQLQKENGENQQVRFIANN